MNNASKQGHGSPLPRGSIAQEWGNWDGSGGDESGADGVKKVVRAGGKAVRSSGFYSSTGYSTGGNAVIWESITNAQIVPHGLTVDEAARVIGAESCMWGEVTDQFFIDQKLWLRTSVLAERLWTPNKTINAYCHDFPCSYDNRNIQARIMKNRCRLVQRGILAQAYNTQIIPDRNRWQQCELWLPTNWSALHGHAFGV